MIGLICLICPISLICLSHTTHHTTHHTTLRIPPSTMPDTAATPAAAQPPAATPPLVIRHDAIWGCYANVTPEQLAKISRYFCASDDELYLNEKTAARLHVPGLDFIVFAGHTRDQLHEDFAERRSPLKAAREIIEAPPPYQPPVSQFLSLDEPKHSVLETPPNFYQNTLGITASDIPGLIRLYQDPEIKLAECNKDLSVPWARIHAQRALVELRAPGIARLMLDEIRDAGEDGFEYYIIDDSYDLLAQLGDEALALVIAEFSAPTTSEDLTISLLEIVRKFAILHPHLRDTCRDAIRQQLENHPVNNPNYNGFLVSVLLDLKAIEDAPLIERAYAADHVDLTVCGDWGDVQIELGLKEKRDTPEPRYHFTPVSNADSEPDIDLILPPSFGKTIPPIRNAAPTVGRNDPCPCGSGKKYKKCCLKGKA